MIKKNTTAKLSLSGVDTMHGIRIFLRITMSWSYTLRARSLPQNLSSGKVPGINGLAAWIPPVVIELITSFKEGRQTIDIEVHLEDKCSKLTSNHRLFVYGLFCRIDNLIQFLTCFFRWAFFTANRCNCNK